MKSIKLHTYFFFNLVARTFHAEMNKYKHMKVKQNENTCQDFFLLQPGFLKEQSTHWAFVPTSSSSVNNTLLSLACCFQLLPPCLGNASASPTEVITFPIKNLCSFTNQHIRSQCSFTFLSPSSIERE